MKHISIQKLINQTPHISIMHKYFININNHQANSIDLDRQIFSFSFSFFLFSTPFFWSSMSFRLLIYKPIENIIRTWAPMCVLKTVTLKAEMIWWQWRRGGTIMVLLWHGQVQTSQWGEFRALPQLTQELG